MLSDLLIGPSPTCQHGNRKLHRRQLPRNLSPVFWIMKRHPAPAERNHTLRDPLIRLRIPVPDTSLDQPPQKPMMLNKRLQKHIQRSADGTPPPGSPQENSTSHSQKTERTDCQPSHKKRAPGPNTQELSQNQTTSSTPPQLPQLPLQPIRTRRY